MFKSLWSLDPQIKYLNHGAFGATPISVLEYQQKIRKKLEREPAHFFQYEYEILLDQSRNQLAQFLTTEPENLVFVTNATTGVNTVLKSLTFAPDQEILITNHTYNACRNTLEYLVERSGVKINLVCLELPIEASTISERILAQVSPKTKLVMLDHITSPSALIFPLAEIIAQLNQQGIETLIDGAHAPGAIKLNLSALGATYYTGNCHKWLCSPKGAGFLYVVPEKQHLIRPLIISHGANSPRRDRSRFQLEFDWQGTLDPSPYLAVQKSLDFMDSLLPGGWEQLRARNHQLIVQARQILLDTLKLSPPCMEEMLGSMAALPLGRTLGNEQLLQQQLFKEYHLEVPIFPWTDPKTSIVRISAQIYNELEEYIYLAEVLKRLLFPVKLLK